MWEFLNRRAGGAQVGGSSLSRVPAGFFFFFFQPCFLHFDLFVATRQKINYRLPQIVSFLFCIIAVFFPILVRPCQAWDAWPHANSRWQQSPPPPLPTNSSSCMLQCNSVATLHMNIEGKKIRELKKNKKNKKSTSRTLVDDWADKENLLGVVFLLKNDSWLCGFIPCWKGDKLGRKKEEVLWRSFINKM